MGSGTRRTFLVGAAGTGVTMLAAGCATVRTGVDRALGNAPADDVPAAERLLRAEALHGRLILVDEEIGRRLSGRATVKPSVITGTAAIVRRFVEDYHAKAEEELVFPRLEHVAQLAGVLPVLHAEHTRCRALTDEILQLAAGKRTKADPLLRTIQAYVRLARTHETREATLVIPALHQLSRRDYDALGDALADREHRLFGPDGFTTISDQITQLEHDLGMDELPTLAKKRARAKSH